MGHLAVIFASVNIPNLKVQHSSENDWQVSHVPKRWKTDIYLTHKAHTGQKLEQLEAFQFWHAFRSKEIRFGATARPTHLISIQKAYKQYKAFDVRIQKQKQCTRTRDRNELRRFENCFVFRKSTFAACAFFPGPMIYPEIKAQCLKIWYLLVSWDYDITKIYRETANGAKSVLNAT